MAHRGRPKGWHWVPTSAPSYGGGWTIRWADDHTFKIEEDGCNLTDADMKDWVQWMDSELDWRFGDEWPHLSASTLNFSRNDLGDAGVRTVVEFLRRREISVHLMKFFKNGIGDDGARAIGDLIAHAPTPVHEVHLSHNRISEQGALAIFDSISRSKRYPFHSDRVGPHRTGRVWTPVWLRMEYNPMNWDVIEPNLKQLKLTWCVSETRDGWIVHDPSPMVCMHHSYRNTQVSPVGGIPSGATGPSATWSAPLPQSSHGGAFGLAHGCNGRGLVRPVGGQPPPASAQSSEEVPMYVFVDASAVIRMMDQEGLFSFDGLLSLCEWGNMTCTPVGQTSCVEESQRLFLAVMDSVFDHLMELADRMPGGKDQVAWLWKSPEAYLQRCHSWGILEFLETKSHAQLVMLQDWETRADELGIPPCLLEMFDFACLWESQIRSRGRVLFVTGDKAVRRFGAEIATAADRAAADGRGQYVPVLHIDDLNRKFAADRVHGGAKLHELVNGHATNACDVVLSSQIMGAIAGCGRGGGRAVGGSVEASAAEAAPTRSLRGTASGRSGSGSAKGVSSASHRAASAGGGKSAGEGVIARALQRVEASSPRRTEVAPPPASNGVHRETPVADTAECTHLRHELREAMAIVGAARSLIHSLRASHGCQGGEACTSVLERIDAAQARWQPMVCPRLQ
eukprot:TRINITY_DN10701_c0_g1_i1.p1 TRINITY_DN10701_c0_g1~~TRINITY_DN10701_c0_g1_i1.p1  ORF type:complete len:681 (+),score=100.57 TRINITY_DN10701_c0_g1_i1:102-2144(+)